jgi:hypothetical protein
MYRINHAAKMSEFENNSEIAKMPHSLEPRTISVLNPLYVTMSILHLQLFVLEGNTSHTDNEHPLYRIYSPVHQTMTCCACIDQLLIAPLLANANHKYYQLQQNLTHFGFL